MSNAETQLLSMSVGLRRQFDFNEVLEAGIGGAVNAYTSVKLNNMSTPFSSNARLNYFEKNLVQLEFLRTNPYDDQDQVPKFAEKVIEFICAQAELRLK